jgi:hypothetical protein
MPDDEQDAELRRAALVIFLGFAVLVIVLGMTYFLIR